MTNLTGGNAGVSATGGPLQNGEIDHNSEAVLNNLRQAAQLGEADHVILTCDYHVDLELGPRAFDLNDHVDMALNSPTCF